MCGGGTNRRDWSRCEDRPACAHTKGKRHYAGCKSLPAHIRSHPAQEPGAVPALPWSKFLICGAWCHTGGVKKSAFIHGRMYQGGEAVSKTACGGFDSLPSVPGQGEETDDSRRFICEQIRCELVGGLLGLIRPISSKVERLAHNRLAQVRFLGGPPAEDWDRKRKR